VRHSQQSSQSEVNVNTPVRNPTLDDAMSELQAMLREALGDRSSDAATRPMTPEEQEEARYRFAEAVLNLACPDPKACSHRHCRRKARCRHLARVAAKRASGKVSHPRRTPGAEAARYAVHVLMSSGRAGTG
jgi:hypothetical protein